jgi:DNA-binding response OmpR family regulator
LLAVGSLALVISDNDVERRFIGSVLAADGFDVIQASRAVDAVFSIAAAEPSLILMASRGGFAFRASRLTAQRLIRIIRRLSDAPMVVIGDPQPIDEMNSLTSGGDVFLPREYSVSELIGRCRLLIRRQDNSPEGRRRPMNSHRGPVTFAQAAQSLLEVIIGGQAQATA